MESPYLANTSPCVRFRPSAQPPAVFHTPRPCFTLTLPYAAPVPYPLYLANAYEGAALGNWSRYNSRAVFLHRSLFDLVAAHPYLALTDPRLLGWYLNLAPEDRKIIQDEGGFQQFLQSHPAFELSKHHVYVKSGAHNIGVNSPDQLTMTSTKDGSQKWPHEEICYTKQLVHLQDSLQMVYNSPITQESEASNQVKLNKERQSHQVASSSSNAVVCKDPAALASLSLDMELERCRQRGNPAHTSQLSVTQDKSTNFTYAKVSPFQSKWTTFQNELSSEHNSTKGQTQDYMACCNEDDVDDNKANLCLEDQSATFHSGMEEDKSIFVCVARDVQKVHSGVVANNGEASCETMKSDQSVIERHHAEKSMSPVSYVPTCGTERALCVSAFTQTDDPKTADKHVLTELHMADLDYLAVEFIKIKMSQEELQEKEKMQNSGCKLRKECDCVQRAQQAELSLLALQYSMCRQHCWRLYYTSAEGGQLTPVGGDVKKYWPKDPPANVVNVLQKLACDYNEMRRKILEGVPLEQLEPLSVDSEKVTTAAGSYVPAQIAGDLLGNVPSRSPNTSGDKNECSDEECANNCQGKAKQVKNDDKTGRAVAHVPQSTGANHEAHGLSENQTTVSKEPTTSEAWYDAEEDLEPGDPAAAAEMGQIPKVTAKDRTYATESANEEAKSSVCRVSNLTQNVTESDAVLSFEKYHTSEVSISSINKDLRPQRAEAAVRKLQGLPLQREHIHRDIGESQSQASISRSEASQDNIKTDTTSISKKLMTQPPFGSSLRNKKVVCILPSPKGTFVPQHYGTMGSFDTLMAELTQRHPGVGRQKIVDALVELRAKHQGVLITLPLTTIREMASELLTKSATQI